MHCNGKKYPYPNSFDDLCADVKIRTGITTAPGGLECLVCSEQKQKQKEAATKAVEAAKEVKPNGTKKENVKI